MSVKMRLGVWSFWTSSPCEWGDNAEKGILSSNCAFGRVGNPPGKTKLMWATTQCGITEGSSIYITQLLLCSAVQAWWRRAVSVLSCHQLVVHWTDWMVFAGCFVLQNWTQIQYLSAWLKMVVSLLVQYCLRTTLEFFLHRYSTTFVTGYQSQHQVIGPISKRRGANLYLFNWHCLGKGLQKCPQEAWEEICN